MGKVRGLEPEIIDLMNEKSFDEIMVGDTASFVHHIREEDVVSFSHLSGDENPLHIDEAYAKSTKFGGRVVQGMFLAALVSRLVGMRLPGKYALLLAEELYFKAPARIGDRVEVAGRVDVKSSATRILEIAVVVKNSSKMILAEGVVKVQVL